jgi:Lar family restriction alleviation protein
MAELKYCPFCGGTNVTVQVWDGDCFVKCGDCFADGPMADLLLGKDALPTEEEAIAAWNRRPTEPGEG